MSGEAKRIYGYYFAIIVENDESGYRAYAPGVGGIYEEGETIEEAKSNAYDSACAVLALRMERDDPITADNEYLKVLTALPERHHIDSIKDIEDGCVATVPA